MNHIEDSVTTKPTMSGPFGHAWRVNAKWLVDFYLVECPCAHPVWHSYLMLVLDLAQRQNLPDPILHLPDATHEFHIWALNPSTNRQPIIDGGEWPSHVLHPMNFAAQVNMSQLEVEAKLVASVADVIHGRISPDTDYTWNWAKIWGDSMLKDHQ